jgi:methylated-DNA-[protein]-cysteine S-methyltransferase
MTAKSNQPTFYAVWATAWGPMGGVWNEYGLARVVLPHYQPDELDQLLAWEHKGCVKDDRPFERLIQLSRDYFNARPADFSEIPCDWPKESTFAGMVLRACRKIPYGNTRSYSSLAEEINQPEAARAVATALGKNRIPLVIPCHRVTYAGGGLGGFSAAGGPDLKRRMLAMEKPKA